MVVVRPSATWAAATVNYHGFAGPGFVVAGTFAAGFDPASYFHVYGDNFGNVVPGHYSRAVADGAFRPIGQGVVSSGFFSASGTDEPAGTPIYLFGFETPDPDSGGIRGFLVTSSDPSFLVPPAMGTTNLDTALVDRFLFGQRQGSGIGFGIFPFPEPGSAILAILGTATLLSGSSRRVR